jgi:hypothetical protein
VYPDISPLVNEKCAMHVLKKSVIARKIEDNMNKEWYDQFWDVESHRKKEALETYAHALMKEMFKLKVSQNNEEKTKG